MPYLFTSESVSEGHPDKVADQISDALIDNFLAFDPTSKVACETLVTTGQVVLAGEVKSKAYLDVQEIARAVIRKIGYTKSEYMFEANSCGILSAIHEQSGDINQGVDRKKKEEQGAGDQGMMFGYATNETANYMPLALDMAHHILLELAAVRRENKQIKYLRCMMCFTHINSRAALCFFKPRKRTLHNFRPEWIVAALLRAHCIHAATLASIQQNTIAVAAFSERHFS